MSDTEILIRTTRKFTLVVITFIGCLILSVIVHLALTFQWIPQGEFHLRNLVTSARTVLIPEVEPVDSAEIAYGKDLIEHTSRYLGPRGSVRPMSNGMNCSNCHLHAGTKTFAANYRAVASTYPKFRHRSGTVEGFEKRVNDCFQRSLNGDTLNSDSREMKAMVVYIKWVGRDVKRGTTPHGSGLLELPWLSRCADTLQGGRLYARYCATCHGKDGEGVTNPDGIEWKYPPLWGADSYSTAAGLFRISRFAAFVKANMPYGVSHETPVLTDEEAWDIAAYVNSQPRPHKVFSQDWPDISRKPVDHPFGPYADGLSEAQHKYGPWDLITAHNQRTWK